MQELRNSLSHDFFTLHSSLQSLTYQMPYYPIRQKSGLDGSDGSSRRQTRSFRPSNNLSLSFIEAKGYDLISEYEQRQWPENIAKAMKDGQVVALKILDPSTEELAILRAIQRHGPNSNHMIKLLDVLSSDGVSDDIIVMPWLSPLDDHTEDPNEDPDVMESFIVQFLEGVCFLHKNNIAHLDLKPRNILVDRTDGSRMPQLSIIDFGMSARVENEETTVRGFRGTPSWTAPEVGRTYDPIMTYSAIRADRWACGRILQHFTRFSQVGGASFRLVCTGLLSLDPHKRPSLDKVLNTAQAEISRSNGKRNGDRSWGYPKKRTRVTVMNTEDLYVSFFSIICLASCLCTGQANNWYPSIIFRYNLRPCFEG